MSSPITLSHLSFEWPDGQVALSDLSGSFSDGRTGLVGRNGSGKSTLLRLIAGQLVPTSGGIEVAGPVGYLPQTLTLGTDATIAQLLGVADTITALRAIEAGDVDQRHFDAVGDDWDVESRAEEALQRLGFTAADLDRRVGELSGGEAILIAISGLRLAHTPVTLLDEPTNNLDRAARLTLAELIDGWKGTLVVVSHDLALLEHMDSTAEIHGGQLSVFGGPYSEWLENLENEQAAALQAARSAEQALKVEKRQRIEAETKLARRERTARKAQLGGGIPRIVAGNLANKAQGSAGSMRAGLDARVDSAQAALDAADSRVREEEHIHLELPDPDVARGRRIAEFTDGTRSIVVQGPERVALNGPNGAGKSTLIARMLGAEVAERLPDTGSATNTAPRSPSGRARGVLSTDRVGFLPQRLDGLDDSASALENVAVVAPRTPPGEIRNQLARLLLRGDSAVRPVSTLSGGERFRVALARLLLADPPAQLLILDEPTNNLDVASVGQLVEALRSYRGAVLIVSHDDAFLEAVSIDVTIELDADGRLAGEKPL